MPGKGTEGKKIVNALYNASVIIVLAERFA